MSEFYFDDDQIEELNKFVNNQINETKSEINPLIKSEQQEYSDLNSFNQRSDLKSYYQFDEKTRIIYELLFTLYENKSYDILKKVITQQFYNNLNHELIAAYIIKNENKNIDISYQIICDICISSSQPNTYYLFKNTNKLLKTTLNLIPLLHYSIKTNLYYHRNLEDSKIFKQLLFSLKNISIGYTHQVLDIELFDVDIKPLYQYIMNNCQTYSLYQTFVNKLVSEMYLDKQIQQKEKNKNENENEYSLICSMGEKTIELESKINDLETLLKENETIKKIKTDLEVENIQLKNQLEENETIKKVKTDLEVENIQLKNQIEELLSNEIKNTELKVKINLLEKKLELIQAEKEHHNEMNTQLKENNFEELLQIQQENEELKEENNKLKSQLEVVNRTIRHMNNVLNKKDYENEDKQREIETKQCLISEKDIIIKEKNEKIKEKEDEIKKIKLKYNKLTKINTNYINRIAKLESMIRKKKINHKLKSDEDTLYRNFMVYLRKSNYELEFIKWLESDDNKTKFMKIISEYFDDLYRFEYQIMLSEDSTNTEIDSVNNVFTINFDELNVGSSNLIDNVIEKKSTDNNKSDNNDIVNDFIDEIQDTCSDEETQNTDDKILASINGNYYN